MQLSSFNLLTTTSRGMEHEAGAELFSLLNELGDPSPKVEQTQVSGLLVAETSLSAYKVVENVREILKHDPWKIQYLLRIIPIDSVVESKVSEIVDAAEKMVNKIGLGEKFRITVEKRHTDLSSKEIIDAVAPIIDNPVDLENPDWIVLIEVVGGKTGVSILKPNQILSIVSLKRGE